MNELINKVKIDMNEEVIQLPDGRVELFRQIPNFSRYWISANGTVISIKNGKLTIRSQKIDRDGYCQIGIYSDKDSIHKGKVKHFQLHR